MTEKNENQEQVMEENEAVEETIETTESSEAVEEIVEEEVAEEVDPVAELEAKLVAEEERYLRLRADFDNLKRRSQLDREAQAKYRAQTLLTDLLPVLDNF